MPDAMEVRLSNLEALVMGLYSRWMTSSTSSSPDIQLEVPPQLVFDFFNGEVGLLYSAYAAAVNSKLPLNFTISSGSLPPGLSLTAATGLISGMPTTAGSYTFTIKVVDGRASALGESTISGTIIIVPPRIYTIPEHSYDPVITRGFSYIDSYPSSGYVTWNGFTIIYKGTAYTISGGNTNLDILVWRKTAAPTVLTAYSLGTNRALPYSGGVPVLGPDDFIIGWNSPVSSTKGFFSEVIDYHDSIGRVLVGVDNISIYTAYGYPSAVILRSSSSSYQPGVIQLFDGQGNARYVSLVGDANPSEIYQLDVAAAAGLNLQGNSAIDVGTKTLVKLTEIKVAGTSYWAALYQ